MMITVLDWSSKNNRHDVADIFTSPIFLEKTIDIVFDFIKMISIHVCSFSHSYCYRRSLQYKFSSNLCF